jgi:hypothetical protein
MSESHGADRPSSHSQRRAPSPPSRWPLLIVAVVAVAALAVALWVLLRPPPAATSVAPTYTDAQRADAKARLCAAFATVRTGVSQNTNLSPPGGPDDVTGTLAVAANARLSLYGGGQYLLSRIDPATAPALADAVRGFANNLIDIGANAIAGVPNSEPAQAARLHDADGQNTSIDGMCK